MKCGEDSKDGIPTAVGPWGGSGADGVGGGRVRKHRPLLISLKSKMPFLQKEQLSYLPWHKCKEQSHFSGKRGHTLRTWDMGKAFFSISNDPVSPFLDANVYLV